LRLPLPSMPELSGCRPRSAPAPGLNAQRQQEKDRSSHHPERGPEQIGPVIPEQGEAGELDAGCCGEDRTADLHLSWPLMAPF
jgi:hypothetical protein